MIHDPIDIGDLAALPRLASIQSFYFLRHGRTEHNLRAICQGSRDIPLDRVGRDQAQTARAVLSGLAIERIVSSPLSRALETARLATDGMSLEIEAEPLLAERNFGEFEGRAAPVGIWESDPPTVEDRSLFARRVAEALLQHCIRQGTLVVAHGGVLRAVAALLRVSLHAAQLENARPLRVERHGSGWIIETLTLPATPPELAQ